MRKAQPLDADLDRYSAIARTVLNLKKPAKRFGELALYTAAAGSALALAPGAEASVIYSGARHIAVHRTQQNDGNSANIAVDLNKDGHADMFFGIYSNTYATGPSNVQKDRAGVFGIVVGSVQAARFFNNGDGDVLKLTASGRDINYPVGANTTAGDLGVLRSHKFINHIVGSTSQIAGLWDPGLKAATTGFAGIVLNTGTTNNVQPHFGWLHFELTTDAQNRTDSLTLIDWAYQSVPGESIHVGEGLPVPEPSGLGLMALGALGIAMLRRRRRGERETSDMARMQ